MLKLANTWPLSLHYSSLVEFSFNGHTNLRQRFRCSIGIHWNFYTQDSCRLLSIFIQWWFHVRFNLQLCSWTDSIFHFGSSFCLPLPHVQCCPVPLGSRHRKFNISRLTRFKVTARATRDLGGDGDPRAANVRIEMAFKVYKYIKYKVFKCPLGILYGYLWVWSLLASLSRINIFLHTSSGQPLILPFLLPSSVLTLLLFGFFTVGACGSREELRSFRCLRQSQVHCEPGQQAWRALGPFLIPDLNGPVKSPVNPPKQISSGCLPWASNRTHLRQWAAVSCTRGHLRAHGYSF